jgi:CubicO group peptidase (beta-lactamase class C family)
MFFGGNSGWGLMMAVPAGLAGSGGQTEHAEPASAARQPDDDGAPRGYGWDGGSGTTWRTDPATGLTGILLTQRMLTSPAPPAVTSAFAAAARAACA